MKTQHNWACRLLALASLLLVCIVLFASCNTEGNIPTDTSNPTDKETDAGNDQTEPHVHSWSEWAVTTEPTCTTDGEVSRSCSCGEVEVQTIEATGHPDVNNDNICDTCQTVRLASGLYDANDNMLASWEELVNTYGVNITKDYDYYDDTDTSLPSRVLTNKEALTNGVKLIIGDVKKIGDFAFGNCNNLTNITIPDSVTSIGRCTFSGCSSLTSITIPDSITSIGNGAFDDCSSLESIVVESNNSKYYSQGNCLIEKDTNILILGCKNSIIPNGITSIGESAFAGCSSLTSITIPESVTSIGSSAFFNCSGLVSITIPDSVTSIGIAAFSLCSSLESIAVDTGNTVYHSDGNCIIETGNKTLIVGCKNSFIPTNGSVMSIGAGAFSGRSSLASITIPDGVTSIRDYAFSGCSSLTSITIPDGVTSIGEGAFVECMSLTSITIPDSVTSIGERAFGSCNSLTSINIPDGVTSIRWTFSGCSSLTSITIPNGVTSIGGMAFNGCSSLTSITIPDSVTSIGGMAFNGCSSLTSITIGNGVTSIGEDAFSGCSGLTSITIPDSVTSIGEDAFLGCSGLTSITIGNSVTSIGYRAFERCNSLTSIIIPNSVTNIGVGAFIGCSSLTSIVVDTNNKHYSSDGGVLYNKDKTELCAYPTASGSYKIPDGVKFIDWYAFSNCSNLTSITIPDGVTSIRNYAFSGCSSLASLIIPDGVKSIGSSAFSDCSSLASITIPDSVKTIGDTIFGDCSSLTSIIFNGTKAQWKAIKKGSIWALHTGDFVIHCIDGDIAK